MSRILKAYETRFFWLMRQARARRPNQGVGWLVAKARRLSANEDLSLADALTRVHECLTLKRPFRTPAPAAAPGAFFCDAGLGGLARWLRGAGYASWWEDGIDDDDLLRQARERAATILTTDSMLMERRVLRDRAIPALWLPPTLGIAEQLKLVFREFNLTVSSPRCMSCGGELRRADKESMRERIPPRTYLWLDEYFECARCGKLFWHGTHWPRIVAALESLAVK